MFVASGDDRARGKHTKGGKLGSGPQPSLLFNLSKRRTTKSTYDMYTCYSVPKRQILSKLHHFRVENKRTLSQR